MAAQGHLEKPGLLSQRPVHPRHRFLIFAVEQMHLRVGIGDVVADLGLSCFVVFHSLVISIDQSIIAERQETFSEPIGGVLLCAGKRISGGPSWRAL